MTDFAKTAEEARRLLRGFAAVESLAKAFEEVGGLEQTKTDTLNAVAASRKDLADLKGEAVAAEAELVRLRAEGKRTTADAKTVADGIVASARAQADAVMAEATAAVATAQATILQANNEAQGALDVIEAKRMETLDALAVLDAKATEVREFLSKIAG